MYISNDIIGSVFLFGAGYLALKGWMFYKDAHAKSVSQVYNIPVTLPNKGSLVAKVYYSGFTHRTDCHFIGEPGKSDIWDDLSSEEIASVNEQFVQALKKIDYRYGRN